MLAALLLALSIPLPSLQDEAASVLEGRVLLPSGELAVGATWSLEGRPASPEREREFGVPDAWRDLSGEVSVHGLVRARFEPDPAFEYVLTITLDGHATETRRWRSIAPGTTTAFEDVRLRATGSLSGTVVDVKGDPLTGTAWTIRAEDARPAARIDERRTRVSVKADPETGRFTIDGLLPGPVDVRLFDLRIGSSDVHRADVRAGRPTALDLVVPELAPFRDRIVVSFADAHDPFAPGPDPAHVWLVGEDGERRNPVRLERERPGPSRVVHVERLDVHLPRSPQPLMFERVGEGVFTLEIDEPNFDAWAQDDVRAGAVIAARLRGSAAIQLEVRSAAGKLVDAYDLDVRRIAGRARPRTERPIAPVEGLVDHLAPGDHELLVFAGGEARRVEVDALAPGEVRAVTVRLAPGGWVRGVVAHGDGTGADGVLVRLVTPAELDDSPDSPIWATNTMGSDPERARRELGRVTAGPDGSFELYVDRPGQYLVVAGRRRAPRVESAVIDTKVAPAPQTLRLEIERGAALEGRVVFAQGLNVEGRRVIFTLQPDVPAIGPAYGSTKLDATGGFRLGPLLPGTIELRLLPLGVTGWSNYSGEPLGRVTLKCGETSTVEFEHVGTGPAKVTFDFTPSELGDAVVTAALVPAVAWDGWIVVGEQRATATTRGEAPRIGPVDIESGAYDLWVTGKGWMAHLSDWTIRPGEDRVDVIDLDRWKRRVRFVRDGEPLTEMIFYISNAPSDLDGLLIVTDEDGYADVHLGAGRYELRADIRDGKKRRLDASFDWPLGEGVEDVVFR